MNNKTLIALIFIPFLSVMCTAIFVAMKQDPSVVILMHQYRWIIQPVCVVGGVGSAAIWAMIISGGSI